MMKAYVIISVILAMVPGIIACAAPVEIIGYENGGKLTFQGGTVSNYFTIEYATSIIGPWTNWGSIAEQPITGEVMVAAGPMYFRVVNADGESIQKYASADHSHSNVPYANDADKVDGLHATEIITGAAIPAGVIVLWSGLTTNVPSGWVLCDGSNNTPDLRDRFVVGASQDEQGVAKTSVSGYLSETGGEAYHTLTIEEMPAHTHNYHDQTSPIGGGEGNDLRRYNGTFETESRGGGQPHNNLPPYYALAYIMKL